MKLIRTEIDLFVFSFEPREKQLLIKVLKNFPRVPAAHHRLSKTSRGAKPKEDQRLLDEALAEQRNQNRQRVETFLQEPERFRPVGNEIHLTLAKTEIDWLLQVLNDVRVGAWLALGEPENFRLSHFSAAKALDVSVMEMSGHFQFQLLHALGYREPTDMGK